MIEDYEEIENRLFMAVHIFDIEWDKAWAGWLKKHNLSSSAGEEIITHFEDGDGYTLPEADDWFKICRTMKERIELEYDADITVDVDGTIFATAHLPDGDTVTVP